MQDLRELAAQRRVELADHRIALFYECRGVTNGTAKRCANLTFEKLEFRKGPRLLDASRLDPANSRSLSGKPVWQREAPSLSPDLHPIAGAILAGSPEGQSGKISCLNLTSPGHSLLDGRYRADASHAVAESDGAGKSGPGLHLTKSVAKYLGLDPSLPVALRIDEVTVFPFRTEVGVVAVELRLLANDGTPPSLPLLIEASHLLCDERASRQPVLSWLNGDGARFRLSDLLAPVLSHTKLEIESDRRVYSYVSAVVDGALDPAMKREIAFRLSRHYNYVYDPDVQGRDATFVTPFNNVTHAMSLEGAATLVDRPTRAEDALPEFLSNWLSVAHRPAYLPMAIIAYHEHLALLELAQQVAIDIDFSEPSKEKVKALTKLCQDFLSFRLRYRPAQISRLTLHNAFSDQLRTALGNDRLAQKATQDAAEAERVLVVLGREKIEQTERQRERRWAWHGAFLSGLVALMAVLGLFEEIEQIASKLMGQEAAVSRVTIVPEPRAELAASTIWERMMHLTPMEGVQITGVLLALMLGIVGGWIGWRRLRHSEHDADETAHELNQQRVERMLKRSREKSEESA